MSTTHEPPLHAHRLHLDPWRVAVVVLAAALVALAAWMVVGTLGGDGATKDEALVDEVFAAWNARDGDAIARLYTKDAVVSFGLEDPNAIIGRSTIQEAASEWGNTVTQVGEPITLRDPPGGFTFPIAGVVDHHYVVTPVLIHDDPFVVVLDVRDGKVSTHMMFEPYEPFRD